MLSIKNNDSNEIIIDKSKFITNLYYINNVDEANNIIKDINNKYSDATHRCYGYIVNNNKRCSDDGEPSGTAGLPILNILEQYELTNILVIVIRYYGGIKLGAGGLIRAYAKCCKEVIKEENICKLINGHKLKIIFNYNYQKQIDYLLKNYNIVNKVYNDKIIYIITIKEDDSIINKLLPYLTEYTIIENILIKE